MRKELRSKKIKKQNKTNKMKNKIMVKQINEEIEQDKKIIDIVCKLGGLSAEKNKKTHETNNNAKTI